MLTSCNFPNHNLAKSHLNRALKKHNAKTHQSQKTLSGNTQLTLNRQMPQVVTLIILCFLNETYAQHIDMKCDDVNLIPCQLGGSIFAIIPLVGLAQVK